MTKASRERRQKRLDRAYLFQNGFVALVAILFLVVSVSFFLDPNQLGRAIGHVPPWDDYWNAFYLVGSALVLIGLFSRRIAIEAAGHILLVPGLVINFLIAAAILGFSSSTLLTVVFALGAALRAYGLILGWQESR
jgi:uncharacterized membrane protein